MREKIINIFSIVSIVLLVIAFAQNPYSYYITMRWFITIFSLVTIFNALKEDYKIIIYLNCAIPIVYNPILPIHLTRSIWEIINIVTILILILNIVLVYKKNVTN